MTWVFSDLTDIELRVYAQQECECRTEARSGTRHGYTCPAHRAQAEIDRRAAGSVAAPKEGQ